MSYDISFKVKVYGTDEWVDVGGDANITWNLRDMITESTGLEWENEADNGMCVDVIPKIQRGLSELWAHPTKYKKYEAENGWGTIDGCVMFFKQIIDEWEFFCQWKSEALINAVHFWIE